jgi:predicted metal-binding protein
MLQRGRFWLVCAMACCEVLDGRRGLKIGMKTHERIGKKIVQFAPCLMAFESLCPGTSRQTLVEVDRIEVENCVIVVYTHALFNKSFTVLYL